MLPGLAVRAAEEAVGFWGAGDLVFHRVPFEGAAKLPGDVGKDAAGARYVAALGTSLDHTAVLARGFEHRLAFHDVDTDGRLDVDVGAGGVEEMAAMHR